MKNKTKKGGFSRVLLAGLFCGVTTAVISNVFFFLYKGVTGIEPNWLINPIMILVIVPLLIVIASIVYYLIVYYFEKRRSLFMYVMAAMMLIGTALILSLSYAEARSGVSENDCLLIGILLITGISICFFLPYLVHHPRIYMTNNHMYWHRRYRSE